MCRNLRLLCRYAEMSIYGYVWDSIYKYVYYLLFFLFQYTQNTAMKPNKRANVKSYAFFKKLFGESWADLSKRYTELFGLVVGRNRCPPNFTTSFPVQLATPQVRVLSLCRKYQGQICINCVYASSYHYGQTGIIGIARLPVSAFWVSAVQICLRKQELQAGKIWKEMRGGRGSQTFLRRSVISRLSPRVYAGASTFQFITDV